jgi:predicted O-methyltransferase YrrM
MQAVWSAVDAYFGDRLAPSDPVLDAALQSNGAAGLPPHDVSRLQGKFLDLMVRITRARRVLEIGTLGGYSTIWFARALPREGHIVSLEVNPHHADVARANIERAGVLDRVTVRVGPALDALDQMSRDNVKPFDLVFIDADKPSNPVYLEAALRLSRPGTVIIGDNVVRDGKVVMPEGADANVIGVRAFTDLIAAHPRLSATALQTVGAKGYDGFVLALVTE